MKLIINSSFIVAIFTLFFGFSATIFAMHSLDPIYVENYFARQGFPDIKVKRIIENENTKNQVENVFAYFPMSEKIQAENFSEMLFNDFNIKSRDLKNPKYVGKHYQGTDGLGVILTPDNKMQLSRMINADEGQELIANFYSSKEEYPNLTLTKTKNGVYVFRSSIEKTMKDLIFSLINCGFVDGNTGITKNNDSFEITINLVQLNKMFDYVLVCRRQQTDLF